MLNLKDISTEDLTNPNLLNNLILKSLQNLENKLDDLSKQISDQDKVQVEQDVTLKMIISRLDRVEQLLEENNIPLIKKDISQERNDFNELKNEITIMKKNIGENAKAIIEIKNNIKDQPNKNKAKIVDYVFKYGLIAIGGLITLKITGILTAIGSLVK
jgi:hypothetical protein